MNNAQCQIVLQAMDNLDLYSNCERRFIDRMAEAPADHALSEQEEKHMQVIERRLLEVLL